MAHGGIALPTDDETPPVRLTRLREKLFVTPARYGTIIVGDIAFILYLITEIIFKGYFIIVLAALLPMLTVSVLNAIIVWKVRQLKEEALDNRSKDPVPLWVSLPIYICCWFATLGFAVGWHIRLSADYYHGTSRPILGSYCGMLMLLDVIFITPLVLDGFLSLLELGDKKLAKRYSRVSAADTEGATGYRDDPTIDEGEGA